MKQILAIHTGGTISMSKDLNGGVTTNQKNPIANQSINENGIQVINDVMFNLPSPQVTLSVMLKIRNRILKAENNGVDGIVVTHGTDTLEETAYFLDLTLPHHIPVIVLGAMRSSNELGADGPSNFKNAINVAASNQSYDRGVMVVMNGEINAARYVTKTHTTNLATFKSPMTGVLGLINKQQPYFFQSVKYQHYQKLSKTVDHVYLLKAYTGMEGTLFNALNNDQTNGLVIEGMGSGNLPAQTLNAIQKLLNRNIPVVLVSRCINGVVQNIYEYEGGGIQLSKMGIIMCHGLNGQKARIKLIVGLSAGLHGKDLAKYMGNTMP